MSLSKRVGCVHALHASIDPTQAAFDRAWPEADVAHLMDGSLYLDRSRGTAGPEEIARRIEALIRHSADTGAEGILFTGSFFADAVRKARPSVQVPVLTSFDGVITSALASGNDLLVMSTAPDSTTLLVEELRAAIDGAGRSTTVSGHVVDGAMDALVAGELDRHDDLVREAIRGSANDRTLVIAQLSMERIIDEAGSLTEAPVIGTATEGAAFLRAVITGEASVPT